MRKTDLERNNLILDLYFNSKQSLTDISTKIDLSIGQISRILSKSPKYIQEKNRRKQENSIKHIEQTKQIMKEKRRIKQLEEKAFLDKLHYQASIELSYFSPISKIGIKRNCSSSYSYNSQKERFELNSDMVYSNDMPKIIKY